ncbi:Cysteine-rich repeat secretory protein 38 [Linum perenne]
MSSSTYLLITILVITLRGGVHAAVDPLFHFCSSSQSSSSSPNDDTAFNGNLKTLFRKLSNQAPPTGFANVSVGGYDANGVYGLALCRADVTSAAACRSCVTDAAREISSRCPSNRSAIIWYDNCMLKYSDTNFFGKIDNNQRFYMWNTRIVADPSTFNRNTKNLLTKLAKEASASSKLFAAGEMEIEGYEKLRGLVQCSRDLSGNDCENCAEGIIGELPSCCDGKEGGRVVGGSCNFRYEIYPFLNGTST